MYSHHSVDSEPIRQPGDIRARGLPGRRHFYLAAFAQAFEHLREPIRIGAAPMQ